MLLKSMRRYSMVGLVVVALILAIIYTLYAWQGQHPYQPGIKLLPKKIPPISTDIKYYGRWDNKDRQEYVSYWGGAYFKTAFTGQHVKLRLGEKAALYASIDGGPDMPYHDVDGLVNLTPQPLAPGKHTLRVAGGSEWTTIHFQGLVLDPGARSVEPTVSSDMIEFIGDSITAGFSDSRNDLSSYAWLTGEKLGAEHVQIATSGICLSSTAPSCAGMDTQFFKLQTLQYPDSPLWDAKRYTPDAVVINLGTNDYNHGQSADAFELSYLVFIANLRLRYPNTAIYAMRTFSGYMELPTRAAVYLLNAAGDHNVFYVDTTGWLTPGSSDFTDAIHPSDSGQSKAATFLAFLLQHRHAGEI
ncbi:endoglucanase [Dictyobacter alpinus]|uniref:Endoglucanase n=1 Tax=Dictyobacter alpinus TaxID=2014873 RepID=A0A402B2Q1_9CHLR|nr:SGNH/GDSL hydrolase family protein [Dictyobacter alpinus]GCE25587.1 endoglucanase [Dictyobacter alpinus]